MKKEWNFTLQGKELQIGEMKMRGDGVEVFRQVHFGGYLIGELVMDTLLGGVKFAPNPDGVKQFPAIEWLSLTKYDFKRAAEDVRRYIADMPLE